MKRESLVLDLEIRALLTYTVSGILSLEDQIRLIELRKKKKHLSDHELLSWQLKSRITWVEMGDANTKYFHSVASACRNQNAIWALKDDEGAWVEDEVELKELGVRYFSNIFKDDH